MRYLTLLISLSFLTNLFAQYSSNPRIENITIEQKFDKIYLNYEILNSNEYDNFIVQIFIHKLIDNQLIVKAKSFTGEIFEVSGGGRKQIIWDVKADSLKLDNIEIYAKIYATLIPKVEKRKAIKETTIFPGSGYKSVGGKNMLLMGYTGYGLIGTSILTSIISKKSYENYESSMDAAERDEYFNKAQLNRKLAFTTLGAGLAIWAFNYIGVLKRAQKSTKPHFNELWHNADFETLTKNSSPFIISFPGDLPPKLFAEFSFITENGNSILEGQEKGLLTIHVVNQGKGVAKQIQVSIHPEKVNSNLKIERSDQEIHYIKSGDEATLEIPIKSDIEVLSGLMKMEIIIKEENHYDLEPAIYELQTLAYQPPKIILAGFEILDAGIGTFAIEEDGLLQKGERVKLKLIVQNAGQAGLNDIYYNINTTDPDIILIDGIQGLLGKMENNQTKELYLTLQTTNRLKVEGNLPIFFNLNEKNQNGKVDSFQIPLALNMKPAKPNILEINSLQNDKQNKNNNIAKQLKVISDNLYNIKAVLPASMKRKKSVGVIFGIRNYKELVPAPYADNDALLMKEYFEKILGIEQVIVYTNEEVSGFIFDDIFNSDIGELQKAIIKDSTEVFVYYSGHGIPDKTGENTYLFPSDGKISRLEIQGYNTVKLYENLNLLGAKHITVILDACFSGTSRSTFSIRQENLVAQKGVIIKPKKFSYFDNHRFTVINSSTDEETSLGYDAAQNGLFTYYLCAGLQGRADENEDKKITLIELKKYITYNVVRTSKKIFGVQTPNFYGNDEEVIVDFSIK
jgi:hypothetical protein